MLSESIPSFEKAGARIEVYVNVVESPHSIISFEDLKELSKGEYEKMNNELKKNNGIPFEHAIKMLNGAYSIESYMAFDIKTDWGKLLADEFVQLLLREGLATWVFAGKGGIRFTRKVTRDKLDDLNITMSEIYNHPLHEWFSTLSGTPVNKKNFLQFVLRNTAKKM